MTWAHWLVMLLFLAALPIVESLRDEERAAANKEDNNGLRNTYRSGYIPSGYKPAARQSTRPQPPTAPNQRQTARR